MSCLKEAFLPLRSYLKEPSPTELFWPLTKLSLNCRAVYYDIKNTKEIISHDKGTRMVKDGGDQHGLQETKVKDQCYACSLLLLKSGFLATVLFSSQTPRSIWLAPRNRDLSFAEIEMWAPITHSAFSIYACSETITELERRRRYKPNQLFLLPVSDFVQSVSRSVKTDQKHAGSSLGAHCDLRDIWTQET